MKTIVLAAVAASALLFTTTSAFAHGRPYPGAYCGPHHRHHGYWRGPAFRPAPRVVYGYPAYGVPFYAAPAAPVYGASSGFSFWFGR